MIVYHGSYCVVDKPNIEFSRDALDFGKGFYITTIMCCKSRNNRYVFEVC